MEGWRGQQGGVKLKHVDVEVLDGGESDGRRHGTVMQGLAMAEVQALWTWGVKG